MLCFSLAIFICTLSIMKRIFSYPAIRHRVSKDFIFVIILPLLSIIVMTSPFLAYYLESIDRSFFLNFCIVFSIHTVLISGTCGDFEADEFISKFLLILLGLFFYLWHLSESLTPEQFLTIFSLFNAFLADLLKFAAQVFIKLWPFGIISFILCEIL